MSRAKSLVNGVPPPFNTMDFTAVCIWRGIEQFQTSSGRTNESSSYLRSNGPNPTLQKGSGLFCLYVAFKFVSTSLPFPAGSVISSIRGLIPSCQVRHDCLPPPSTAAWCEAHGADIYMPHRAEEVTGPTATKRKTNTSAAAAFVIIWYRVRLIVLFSWLLDLENHLPFADAGRATVQKK